MGLSQSALSERVSALEHDLGARLLFRTTRQVSLTQAGSEFVRDAKRILADIERSVSNVRHTAESDLRHIRVSGVDEAISMLLPQALLDLVLRTACPGVDWPSNRCSLRSDASTRRIHYQRAASSAACFGGNCRYQPAFRLRVPFRVRHRRPTDRGLSQARATNPARGIVEGVPANRHPAKHSVRDHR